MSASETGIPIGTVERIDGDVFVIRADGTRVALDYGDPVFQGDVLETGADGAVGIVLADETSFAMGENGRMVLDEMVYDPAGQDGSLNLAVARGVFTFVSGQIAKMDPDAMVIETPVATIGIRGTQAGVRFVDGQTLDVVLMEEADGFVGEVVVFNADGTVTMNQAHQLATVVDFGAAPFLAKSLTPEGVVEHFGPALRHLPLRYAPENDYGLGDEAGAELEEFLTAAGGEPDAIDVGSVPFTLGDEGGDDPVPAAGPAPTADPEPTDAPDDGDGPDADRDPGTPAGDGDGPANEAPVLTANEGLSAHAGGVAVIGAEALAVSDADHGAEDILFTLTDAPDHGTIERFDDAAGWTAVAEGAAGAFTQADIDAGHVRYVADAPEIFAQDWLVGASVWTGVVERQGMNPSGVDPADLVVPDNTHTITLTFEGEGAGYRNTIGWYALDADGNPGEAHLAWANASRVGSGGDLVAGTSQVTLDGLEPGDDFGLFLVSDGWRQHSWLREVDEDWALGFDADGNLVGTDGTDTHVIDADRTASKGVIYHATEPHEATGVVHAHSGVEPTSGRLFIGFEDLRGGGDRDYNDVIVSIGFDGDDQIAEADEFELAAYDADGAGLVAGDGYAVTPDHTATVAVDVGAPTLLG